MTPPHLHQLKKMSISNTEYIFVCSDPHCHYVHDDDWSGTGGPVAYSQPDVSESDSFVQPTPAAHIPAGDTPTYSRKRLDELVAMWNKTVQKLADDNRKLRVHSLDQRDQFIQRLRGIITSNNMDGCVTPWGEIESAYIQTFGVSP